ncbi:MAG: hypothetical protein ACP5KV_07200 [Candidatus Methanomethylicaceae archaeon]
MDNIKASYDLIKEMKRMKVPFLLLEPNEPIPESVSAVISFHAKKCDYANKVVYDGNAKRTILRALSLSSPSKSEKDGFFDLVVVGIDPGKRTGMAILADGELIEAHTLSEEDLEKEVLGILEDYPAHIIVFRLGKGEISKRVLDIIRRDARAKIEFVDETKMSVPSKYRAKKLRKDARSALIIALSGKVDHSKVQVL